MRLDGRAEWLRDSLHVVDERVQVDRSARALREYAEAVAEQS
jgi:hypothetical protein